MCCMSTEPATGAVTFEAVIVPHRSLSRRGLRRLVAALLLLSAGVSGGFWYLGAWPVMGFSGAEVLLAAWLLRRHARGAAAAEMLLLVRGWAAGDPHRRTGAPMGAGAAGGVAAG